MLNRIDKRMFNSSVSFLTETIFDTVDGTDFLYIYNILTKKDDKILVVTSICDSRFQKTITLPAMTIRALARTLSEGKIIELTNQKISMFPTIETWKFSDWIDTGPGSMQWDRLLSWKNLAAHQKDFRNYPTFKSNISNEE